MQFLKVHLISLNVLFAISNRVHLMSLMTSSLWNLLNKSGTSNLPFKAVKNTKVDACFANLSLDLAMSGDDQKKEKWEKKSCFQLSRFSFPFLTPKVLTYFCAEPSKLKGRKEKKRGSCVAERHQKCANEISPSPSQSQWETRCYYNYYLLPFAHRHHQHHHQHHRGIRDSNTLAFAFDATRQLHQMTNEFATIDLSCVWQSIFFRVIARATPTARPLLVAINLSFSSVS